MPPPPFLILFAICSLLSLLPTFCKFVLGPTLPARSTPWQLMHLFVVKSSCAFTNAGLLSAAAVAAGVFVAALPPEVPPPQAAALEPSAQWRARRSCVYTAYCVQRRIDVSRIADSGIDIRSGCGTQAFLPCDSHCNSLSYDAGA